MQVGTPDKFAFRLLRAEQLAHVVGSKSNGKQNDGFPAVVAPVGLLEEELGKAPLSRLRDGRRLHFLGSDQGGHGCHGGPKQVLPRPSLQS